MSKKPIIILGGGPTGLAAAYRLSLDGEKVILLEKEKHLGGLSATLEKEGFLYEFGPHAFHLNDPGVVSWVRELLDRDFRVIPTNTKALIDNNFLNYPLKAGELLRKVNPILGARILFDYFIAHLKNIVLKRKAISFEHWGLTNFGSTLYKISFGDYTNKVWGISPKKISVHLASQKLARLNLGDIIKKLLGLKGEVQPAYFKKYLYPEGGANSIFEKLEKKIAENGQIIYNAEALHLKTNNDKVESVEYKDEKGKFHKIACQKIISTITLKDLVPMINSPLASTSQKAASALKFRDLIIIYLIVAKNQLSEAQWTYLVENKFRFNRFTEGKNLSPRFAPKGKTVISFEICCQKGDLLWRLADQKLLKLLKEDLKKLDLDNLEVENYFVVRLENAYPMFLVGFEQNLFKTLNELAKIENLISTGRNGLFMNSDIHDCFKLGFEAARFIQKNKSSKNWYKQVKNTWLKNL